MNIENPFLDPRKTNNQIDTRCTDVLVDVTNLYKRWVLRGRARDKLSQLHRHRLEDIGMTFYQARNVDEAEFHDKMG